MADAGDGADSCRARAATKPPTKVSPSPIFVGVSVSRTRAGTARTRLFAQVSELGRADYFITDGSPPAELSAAPAGADVEMLIAS